MAMMTQAAYAKSRGITKQAVGDLVRRGVLTLVDRKIDSEYADLQLVRSLNPAKSKALNTLGADDDLEVDTPPSSSKVTSMSEYQTARLARERIELKNAELDYEERVGSLIDRAGVLRALKEAGRALSDQMMGLPRRLAPELAGCGDPQRAEKELEREFRLVLQQFAQQLVSKLEANKPIDG